MKAEVIRPALAAAVVAARGGRAVVAGTTALWLHGHDVDPNDLDLVPDPGALDRLGLALDGLVPATGVPSPARLRERSIVSLATSYGPVDLLLERGRDDHGDLDRRAVDVVVAGVAVRVASADDALALRRRFKELPHG